MATADGAAQTFDADTGETTGSVKCGASKCTGSSMFAACCVDAATSTCGVENKAVGVTCGVPAVADPSCPAVDVDFVGTVIKVAGCCTERGVCGGFNLGSPCALVRSDADAGNELSCDGPK